MFAIAEERGFLLLSRLSFFVARYNATDTPLEKRTQVWFELQEEISFAHEFLMKMLPENGKIKKIYRGTYTTDV